MAGQNWGRVDNFRYNCCFICVDASLPVLDRYVEERVDCMIEAGLLHEVFEIYNPNADYTRGLRQAIGVQEFENFLGVCSFKSRNDEGSNLDVWPLSMKSINQGNKMCIENIKVDLDFYKDNHPNMLLKEAIEKMKQNTRRLVRRQVSISYFLSVFSCQIPMDFQLLNILMMWLLIWEGVMLYSHVL